jgi:integrase
MELEFWRHQCGDPDDDEFVFRSRKKAPLNGHNYHRRFLAPLAKKNGIEGLTFQCLRRTFATLFQKHGTVKDAQSQLRHSDAGTTMNIYTQEIPSSVRAAVEALDQRLCGVLNTIEHGLKM